MENVFSWNILFWKIDARSAIDSLILIQSSLFAWSDLQQDSMMLIRTLLKLNL